MAITKESFGAQVTNTSLSREGKSQNISDRAISLMDQMKDQQVDADYTLIHVSQREIIVEFQEGSAANPQNWTLKKKLFNAIAAFLIIVNCGISSALPSNAAPTIMSEFGQAGIDEWSSLPNAVYLMGYVVGSVIFSALSETIGRRPVLLGSFTVFVLGTLACALAPNWPSLLVFRAICGLAGSAPQTVIGGLYADIFFDARTRGRAMLSYTSAREKKAD
ncbi:hypothetical protein UA08_05937 [Talaromyces atroroseus]|uniref:Uncharacterized protein n=1 Tax=Talaromyces atroroseus TaxID=1441469 RepID=A0A225ACM5_TALAT|nr:hypothetical protein UA08_05937 [Talaromyces atroroseus]OKL58862.1 hypothetical protein UA08_05937 [Talaromyces atroroseus]